MVACLLVVVLLAQQVPPSFETIARGGSSGVEQAQEQFVRTEAEWRALWKTHGASQAVPAVEFSTHAVAAVFLGTRPTSGFSVDTVGTHREGDTLVIEYVERRPNPGAIVSQVLTSSFHIVLVPRHDGPVRFQKKTIER